MTGKRDYLYFELFQEGVRYAMEAAALLHRDLEHFDSSGLDEQIDAMHQPGAPGGFNQTSGNGKADPGIYHSPGA